MAHANGSSSKVGSAHYLETTPCDHCGSTWSLTLDDGDDFRGINVLEVLGVNDARLRTVVCLRCGWIYSSPRLSASALTELYGSGYGEGAFYGFAKGGRRKPPPSPDDAKAVAKHAGKTPGDPERMKIQLKRARIEVEGRSILDVRCKSGAFLAEMKQMGAAVRGLEDEPFLLKCCEVLGVPAEPFSLVDPAQTELEGTFDLIRLNNTLAHSPSPSRTLQHFARHLNPRGHLFIDEPDILLRNAGPFPVVPFHFWHPTRKSTEALLAAAGFRVKRVYRRVSVLWTFAQGGYAECKLKADNPFAVWWHFTKWRYRNRKTALEQAAEI